MTDPTVDPEPGERCPGCDAPIDDSWLVCAWCGTALAAPAELASAAVLLDRFVVQRVLGRGGFGITYEVDDTRLQRRVALKELFPPTAVRHGSRVLAAPADRDEFRAARDRFLREARLLARFSHAGIVRVYEVFEAHNTAYLVMELLDGSTLAELLQERGQVFTPAEVLDVAARVGAALADVHAADLLHRDVNPTNVMVTTSGRVVLIDFGLARRYGGDATAAVTRMVTPGYAPPEQYRGTGPFGPSTDVYGLAATLYRLLTGQTPPSAFDRQGGAPLPAPHALVPSVPKLLSDAVLDGLELEPAHRPATAAAFLARLGLHGLEPGPRAVVADLAVSPPAVAPPAVPTPDATAGGIPHDTAHASPDRPPVPPVAALPAPVARRGVLAAPVGAAAPQQWAAAHRVVGPHPKGRPWLTIPTGAAVAALASSTPVVITAVLVLLALPALATFGDLYLHRHRLAIGATPRRWDRAAPGTVAPVHALRNVVLSVMRAVPALAIGGVVALVAYLAGHGEGSAALRDAVVRVGGALVACTLIIPARHDGRGFRAGTGLDTVVAAFLDDRGRPTLRGWSMVVVSIALTAAGLWLKPELWPLSW